MSIATETYIDVSYIKKIEEETMKIAKEHVMGIKIQKHPRSGIK